MRGWLRFARYLARPRPVLAAAVAAGSIGTVALTAGRVSVDSESPERHARVLGEDVEGVDVVLNGEAGDVTLSFEGAGCPDALAPGSVCTARLTIANGGDRAGRFNVQTRDSDDSCYASAWVPADSGNAHSFRLEPGESREGDATVELKGAAERCASSSNSTTITVRADEAGGKGG
ncbi:MAG TPA: hypothetical protein VI916_02230 [Acidimicrobiia bacterium]|nr:hypothetical protein [Acidimicrobiia bacterium]